jgi:hypothetical protein
VPAAAAAAGAAGQAYRAVLRCVSGSAVC